VAVHDDDTLTFSIEQDAPPETQTRIESLLEQEAQTWFGHPRDPRRLKSPGHDEGLHET
jgi:hypothetical protein